MDSVKKLLKNAVETQNTDLIDIAMDILKQSGNMFTDQIRKIVDQLEEWDEENILIETLLELLNKQPQAVKNDVFKTKKIAVNKVDRGPNLFDPNEYSDYYQDEEHKKFKSQNKPTKKASYEHTLKEVNCTTCGKAFKIPAALFVGKDFGNKCDNCIPKGVTR